MYALLAIPAGTFAVILALSLAPLFDFRRRPLSGSIGTCAFGKLSEPAPIHSESELEAIAAFAEGYGL